MLRNYNAGVGANEHSQSMDEAAKAILAKWWPARLETESKCHWNARTSITLYKVPEGRSMEWG